MRCRAGCFFDLNAVDVIVTLPLASYDQAGDGNELEMGFRRGRPAHRLVVGVEVRIVTNNERRRRQGLGYLLLVSWLVLSCWAFVYTFSRMASSIGVADAIRGVVENSRNRRGLRNKVEDMLLDSQRDQERVKSQRPVDADTRSRAA